MKEDLAYLTQGSMSIAAYFTKFRGLSNEHVNLPKCIWNCWWGATNKLEEHDKIQRVTQFLMGSNDTYITIRGQIDDATIIWSEPGICSSYLGRKTKRM